MMEKELQEGNYQEILNKILKNPAHPRYSILFKNQVDKIYQNVEKDYDESFYGKFQTFFIDAKVKIIQLLHENLTIAQEKQLEELQSIVNQLTLDTQYILKTGIMEIYLNLCQLKNKENTQLHDDLIERIKKILQNLLRYHFVYKNYRDFEKKEREKQDKFLSLSNSSKKNLDVYLKSHSTDKIQTNELYIEEIKQKHKGLSVHELFNQYLKGEENEINNTLETCRICSSKVKLDQIHKHISYCQKKAKIKSRIAQITQEEDEVLEDLKKRAETLDLISGKSEEEEEMASIVQEIIHFLNKNKKCIRRHSMIVRKKNFDDFEIRNKIQIFQESFGKDELLEKVLDLVKEKCLLSRKKQSLEVNFYQTTNSEHQESSPQASYKTLTSSLHELKQSMHDLKPRAAINAKTRKSIFAKKSSEHSEHSEHSESQKSSCHHISKRRKSRLNESLKKSLRKMQSIRGYSEEKALQTKKSCKSLTEIPLQLNHESVNISLKSFQILKFLGKGSFGRVYLVRRLETQNLYALKIIKIKQTWGEKQLLLIKNEHEIFKKIAGTHLVKAPFSFSEGAAHCFILEFMPGGDLGKILTNQVYLQQNEARFYLAEIVLAIEHLHQSEIIHRDLKPQNLVIDNTGHLKLTDFGLSEIRIEDKLKKAKQISLTEEKLNQKDSCRHQTFVSTGGSKISRLPKKSNARLIGTPDYIAPEIIEKTSLDNLSIDWWSLGVIAYELMIGVRPFSGDTIQEVIDNIVNFKIEWPQIGNEDGMVSQQAVDLIKKLLNMNYKERLGAKSVQQIKDHPFFEGISWESIKDQSPPIMPEIEDIKEYQFQQQDKTLVKEIKEIIKKEKSRKSQLKLETMVRYDLLAVETCQSIERKLSKNDEKMKLLERIAQRFPIESKAPKKTPTQQNYRRCSLQLKLEHLPFNG